MVSKKKTVSKKKKEVEIGKCIDCANAYLMRSNKENPIVNLCKINNDRQVAEMFTCRIGCFKKRTEELVINKMIYAK